MDIYQRLARSAIINLWLQSPSSAWIESYLSSGWDSITIDLQHGLMGLDGCISLLGGLCGQAPLVLVRVSGLNEAEIGKVLDAGADGVICPLINNADAARRLVRACTYPPGGERSFGPTRHRLSAQYHELEYRNRPVAIFAMIESAAALEGVEEIGSVEGLTGLYVGPSDLGMDFGIGPGFDRADPSIHEAIKRVIGTADRLNLIAGVHCASPVYAASMLDWGARFVTLTSDYALVRTASRSAVKSLRDLLPTGQMPR